MEHRHRRRHWRNISALVNDVEVDDTGLVYAPTEPGLSYEIDWNLVKRDFVGEIS